VLADYVSEDECKKVTLSETCEGYEQNEVDELLARYGQVVIFLAEMKPALSL